MTKDTTRGTAVVVGVTGIVGRAIAAKLVELGGWRVLGVTRSGGTVAGIDQSIAVDLLDPKKARECLAPANGATHLFFAAYHPQTNWVAEVEPNLALLVNAIEGLEAVGAPLQHVTLITGAKYYGVHVGPSPAPAAETECRHIGPNFYYAQGVAVGGVAIGGLGIGGIALGGAAIGGVAVGGGACGYYACGGGALGKYTVSALGRIPEAVEFFRPWLPWVGR